MGNLKGIAVLTGLLMALVIPVMAEQSLIDSVAVVTDHSGSAMVYTGGAWKDAEINMPLYEGDAVKTAADSALEVTFDDATIVKLGDNTELKLTELKRQGNVATTIFNLLKGKFMAIVDHLTNPESRFEVHTKMAIAAVKGTELAVEADDNNTNLGVYTGAVAFTGANGGSIKGAAMVIVDKGNESGCGGSGVPGKPASIKYMGKFEKEFGNLRETVSVIRELKAKGGDAVYQWRIKKKLEKGGKVVGTSDTEGTIGGVNKNIGQVKEKIQKALRAKLQKEFYNEKSHAYKDLKFINESMAADLHLGKTMTDVHGNRVRMEEFVFRPAANQIDLLSLTLRDKDKMDYLRLQNIFANPIPVKPTGQEWRSMWARSWSLQPANYLTEQSIKMSNIIDWVFIGSLYNAPATIVGAAAYGYVLPKSQEILAFSNLSAVGNGLPAEFDTALGDMNTANFINDPLNNQFVREHRIYSAPYIYLAAVKQDVCRGALDKTFTNFTDYSTTMTFYNSTPAIADSASFAAKIYTETNTYAEGGVSGDLSIKHVRKYNDGSTLALNMYLINDYGNVMQIPNFKQGIWTALMGIGDILFNSNVELMMKSNQFIDKTGGIDVVSKLLWWLILNPQNVNNKPPLETTFAAPMAVLVP